jgi:acetyl-CoA carboxylase biotin carboxylase subunit
MFSTVLIANRGEIALRVARACRELGIRVASVHSTEDVGDLLAGSADATVRIGPAAARRSYLNIPALIEAARRVGADAVHPGYGFLSEEAEFAEACAEHDLVFIGPPPAVLEQLGDKAAARSLMSGAGLPLLPGSPEPVNTVAEAQQLCAELGFPVIVKAVSGGGGRGMQIISDAADVARQYLLTRATAQQLFGDSRVFIERYLPAARHVEIQILCDNYGAGIHLGARDCSTQRRHQKLIEEAPPPGLPGELVAEMGELALRGALAAGYRGVGTFEFLLDPATRRYYFMEVNGRIQVEHPVTEMITGIDLVQQQLRIAAGESLAIKQSEVSPRGVAIECRVNAEDPRRDFRPTPGTLTEFVVPGGPFVRVDTAAHVGGRISSAYDSLLAKVIAWGPDRPSALARMSRALREFKVDGPGVHTTAEFLDELIRHPDFAAASHDTGLVAKALAEPAEAA